MRLGNIKPMDNEVCELNSEKELEDLELNESLIHLIDEKQLIGRIIGRAQNNLVQPGRREK